MSFLGLSTIAKTHKFDLRGSNTIKKRRDKSIRIRFSSSSFAFLAKTNIPSKTRVILYFVLCNFSNWIDLDLMECIKKELHSFGKLDYICVGSNESIEELKNKTMIQIIFNKKITFRNWFMDSITSKH